MSTRFQLFKKKSKNIGKCRNLCLMNDFFNTAHQSATCVSHNVAECIDNGVDGSMGMNIYWLAKPPLRIASIYRRIPASTPNMLVLPASMQQIVLFSGPRATSQVHPWYRCPFQFSQSIWIISIKIFKKEKLIKPTSKCEYHYRYQSREINNIQLLWNI